MSDLSGAKFNATRPVAVPVVATFLWAATAIAALVGTSLLIFGTLPDRIWSLNPPARIAFSAHTRISGALLLLVGTATTAAAAGLMRGRRWAWLLALAIFSLNGLGDLITVLFKQDWIKGGSGLLIAGIFLLLLLRPSVRAFFADPV